MLIRLFTTKIDKYGVNIIISKIFYLGNKSK